MTRKVLIICLCTVTFVLPGYVQGDMKLKTPDGKAVLLMENMTWKYINTKQSHPNKYIAIDLDDITMDGESFNGKRVKTTGLGKYVANMFTLSRGMMDTNIVMVNIKNLPRNLKKEILNKCNMFGCQVTVYGKIKRGELIAEKVTW